MPDDPVLANYYPTAQMNGVPTSGVGYVTPFTGRPDPWPNNRAIQPNSLLRQTFIDRYGVPPGYPPADYLPGDVLNNGTVVTVQTKSPNTRIGYSGELFTVNGIMLKNKAIEGIFGPGMDDAEPTLTEMTDASFIIRRGSKEAQHDWWEAATQGGMQSTAIVVSKTDKPAGYYTEPSAHGWPIYYLNVVNPDVPPTEPPPVEPPKPAYPLPDPPSAEVLETAALAPTWVPKKRPKQRERLEDHGDYTRYIDQWIKDHR